MRRCVPTFRIRYHECDPQGVVFNAHYLALFDMAIGELWRDMGAGYDAMVRSGVDIVVGEANVRFLDAAHHDDLVEVAAQVAELGTTSMRTEFEVTRDGTLLATGWTRHVFVRTPEMVKCPIPDDIRAVLAEPVNSTVGLA